MAKNGPLAIVNQKRCRYTLACNFTKCWHIFRIISLRNKFVIKSTLQIAPHLESVARQPCQKHGTFSTNNGQMDCIFCTTLYLTFLHSATSSSSASFGSRSSTNRTLILVDRNVIARSRICSSPCRICEKMPVSAPDTPQVTSFWAKMSAAHKICFQRSTQILQFRVITTFS